MSAPDLLPKLAQTQQVLRSHPAQAWHLQKRWDGKTLGSVSLQYLYLSLYRYFFF